MMAVTDSLSPQRHRRFKNRQMEIYKVVPQMVSTLRRDLYFWQNLPDLTEKLMKELMAEKQKRHDMEKKNQDATKAADEKFTKERQKTHDMEKKYQDAYRAAVEKLNQQELNSVKSQFLHIQASYRRYLEDGIKLALEPLSFDTNYLLQTLFPDTDSINQWNFDAAAFQSIKVMEDPDYFDLIIHRRLNEGRRKFQWVHSHGEYYFFSDSEFSYTDHNGRHHDSKGFNSFMFELYAKLGKILDEKPQTQPYFDGLVSETVIRELCIEFTQSIEEIATKHEIQNYLKPHFTALCVVFAAFKMLLPRLTLNRLNDKILKTINQVDSKKDLFKLSWLKMLNETQKSQK